MVKWWEALTILQKIFACVAIPSTVFLILQTIMLIVGIGGNSDADHGLDGGHDTDGDHDFDGDHDHDHNTPHEHHDSGLRIFSIRALISFFTVFGWLGIVLTKGGLTSYLAILIAAAAGGLSMYFTAWALKAMLRLQDSGNIEVRNSVGKTGTVYIPIPPGRSGKGKVTVIIQGRLTEVDAVTECEARLKTGTEVVIVSVSNQDVVNVLPKNAPKRSERSEISRQEETQNKPN